MLIAVLSNLRRPAAACRLLLELDGDIRSPSEHRPEHQPRAAAAGLAPRQHLFAVDDGEPKANQLREPGNYCTCRQLRLTVEDLPRFCERVLRLVGRRLPAHEGDPAYGADGRLDMMPAMPSPGGLPAGLRNSAFGLTDPRRIVIVVT